MMTNRTTVTILQNKYLYFPVAQLYRNFNTLPPSKLHQLPLVLGDYFVLNRSIHTYNTRNRSNFHLDSVNTTFGKRSLKNLKEQCYGIVSQHP